MKIFKFLILFAGGGCCLSSLADTYKRGNFTCHGGLSAAERDYHRKPDNEYNQAEYGLCLIAANQDEDGLIHLRSAGEKGHITAVFDLARYYQTGGTLDDQVLEPNNIQQAIDLYLRVTQMIKDYPAYPLGGARWGEIHYSMEMNTYYKVVSLYYAKFFRGILGAHNFHNNGNQENKEKGKETYLDYREHTTDSLQKTIQYADICLSVPLKHYFYENKYNRYQSLCRIFKSAAEDILNQGLNADRIHLINDPVCAQNLKNCERYQEVVDQTKRILHRVQAQTAEVWNNS